MISVGPMAIVTISSPSMGRGYLWEIQEAILVEAERRVFEAVADLSDAKEGEAVNHAVAAGTDPGRRGKATLHMTESALDGVWEEWWGRICIPAAGANCLGQSCRLCYTTMAERVVGVVQLSERICSCRRG